VPLQCCVSQYSSKMAIWNGAYVLSLLAGAVAGQSGELLCINGIGMTTNCHSDHRHGNKFFVERTGNVISVPC
jgi:hypothetical protein